MTTPATTSSTPTTGTATRLRSGELRAMVARVLADDPGTGMTPRVVAAKLGGRSSGAVGNALKVLAECGAAEVVLSAPLTYRATATTTVLAGPAATPAPPPPRRPRRTKSPAPATVPEPPTPSKPAATTAVVTGPVTRPNGLTYHPRLLSGMPDVTALHRLREAGV